MTVTIGKYTFPNTELGSEGSGADYNGAEATATIKFKTDAVEGVAEVRDPESGEIITPAVAAVPAKLTLSDGTEWSHDDGTDSWKPVANEPASNVSTTVTGGRRSRRRRSNKKKMSKGWGGSKKQKKRKGSKKRR